MRKIKNQKPFIYYEDLKHWEIVSMIFYAIVTIGVSLTYILANSEAKQLTIIMYIVLTQLLLYFFLYTSLRNFRSYLIWCGFGLIHVVLYLIFKDNPELQMKKGNPSTGLVNTIVLLLLFQLLRYISRKIQHREFVAPAKGGGPDLFENKKVTFTDFVIFVIYMGSWFGLTILTLSR
jgi:FtsH-binding integral membrane protein